ncbi:hypothetical protein ACIQYG_21815 [Peribacillus sp. NPDC096622]|uniref:hypothetical protein n=1 Tax=Peribacillus sp. NPDC096622 TaxID=3364396 RepID=UPI00381D0907
MKKPFYLLGLTIFLISLVFNTSNAEASKSSNSTNDLVTIDTSIVPDSYELEVLVNKNDANKEDLTIFVDDHKYKIADGKLVEDSIPSFRTYATTDSRTATLYNGQKLLWTKYASSGTTVHTGSTGIDELREHTIKNSSGTVLSSIKSSAGSIGCQKTVTSSGNYTFSIQNLSATTQTWNWTVTF